MIKNNGVSGVDTQPLRHRGIESRETERRNYEKRLMIIFVEWANPGGGWDREQREKPVQKGNGFSKTPSAGPNRLMTKKQKRDPLLEWGLVGRTQPDKGEQKNFQPGGKTASLRSLVSVTRKAMDLLNKSVDEGDR